MRLVGFGLAAVGWLSAPAAAQLSARVDLTTSNRYVWHGLSRAGGLVAQPSLAAGLRLDRLSLEAGAAAHYELDHVAAGELSETGTGARHLGEADLWGKVALELGPIRLHSGVARYLFRGDPGAGGIGPERNTTEVYAALSATGTYLNPSLEAWWDVDRVRGAYLQGSASLPLLGWPFPPYMFAFVDGDVGLNLGQGPNTARPGELANFAGRGVTHVGVGVAVELRAARVSGLGWTSLALGLRSQLDFDDATRFNGAGRRSDGTVWAWAGVTILTGREARDLR
jgi:hypothetical protein